MSSFYRDELTLAFTWLMLQEIGEADGRVDPSEQALLDTTVPRAKLEAADFIGADGAPTARFIEARDAALERLPVELTLPDKLALLTHFLDMCVVDGHLDRSESGLLTRASDLLGVRPSEFDAHLDTLTDRVGSVDLPEPE